MNYPVAMDIFASILHGIMYEYITIHIYLYLYAASWSNDFCLVCITCSGADVTNSQSLIDNVCDPHPRHSIFHYIDSDMFRI